MKRTQPRGLTLPEVMLSMTIGTMVLGVSYPVLEGTVRYMLQADADVQTQSQAVLLNEKVFSDFAFSSPSSLTVGQDPPSASFLSQEECRFVVPPLAANTYYTPSTSTSDPLVWRKFVALCYHAETQTLDRIEFPYTGVAQLAVQTPAQLRAALTLPVYAASTRTVATGIERFRMMATSAGSLHIEFFNSRKARDVQSNRVSLLLTMRN